MPLFYFHVIDCGGFAQDMQGQDVADVRAARAVAVEGARSMMAEELRDGELNLSAFIRVEDQSHKLVFAMPFADAVKIRGRSLTA